MIGNVLEATVDSKPVLVLEVSINTKRALILKTNSKLDVVDLAKIDVLWHYDENDGWLPDFPRDG